MEGEIYIMLVHQKYIINILIFLILAAIMTFLTVSCINSSKVGSNTYKDSKGREPVEAIFENPPISYRPLKNLFGKLNPGEINKVMELGFGGIVTQVPVQGYLCNDTAWEILKDNLKYASKRGIKVWLLDEYGWPSGSAGGLVLKDRPDLEAQGLVCIYMDICGSRTVSIKHPSGHGRVVLVSAYKGKSFDDINLKEVINLESFLDSNGNLEWTSPEGNWFICYFVQKPYYEMTHAENNWVESRRYVNLMDKDATMKFIEYTHKRYYDKVGQYFGNCIEAFFTEEPQLVGNYLGRPPVKPRIKDKPNADLPLLATLNWGNNLPTEFRKRRGYNIMEYLPYLFGGDSIEACQVRWDYYKTLSELMEENFAKPYGDFCEKHNVAFTGHMLFEEYIIHHPVYTGNYFSILRHMTFPGMDMLSTFPETVKDWSMTTAKFVSSIAHFYGKKNVVSEISSSIDGDRKFSIEEMMGSVAIQYSLGVDRFASFYYQDYFSDEEIKTFCDFTARIGYILDRGKHIARVAIYYPIESMWCYTLPTDQIYGGFRDSIIYNSIADLIDKNYKNVIKTMIENQIDFEILDSESIMKCTFKNGKLKTPLGQEFELLIIPQLTALDTRLLKTLDVLAQSGLKIILQSDGTTPIFENGSNKIKAKRLYEQFTKKDKVFKIGQFQNIPIMVGELITRDVKLDRNIPHIMYLKKQIDNMDIYLFVNSSKDNINFNAQINSASKRVRIWNALKGEVSKVDIETDEESKSTNLKISLSGYEAVIVSIEK